MFTVPSRGRSSALYIRLQFVLQGREIVLHRMEDMHDTDFFFVLKDAEYDKVVAYGIAAVAHAGEDGIATKFVGGGKLPKRIAASLHAIGEFCRRQRVLKFVCDVLEGVEKVGVGRWRYDDFIHVALISESAFLASRPLPASISASDRAIDS